MKRVFIIHGWEGFPEEGWFPWLKNELEAKGFEVHVPNMPDSEHPRIQKWAELSLLQVFLNVLWDLEKNRDLKKQKIIGFRRQLIWQK